MGTNCLLRYMTPPIVITWCEERCWPRCEQLLPLAEFANIHAGNASQSGCNTPMAGGDDITQSLKAQ
jgi:hypothetical protein